MSGWGEPGAVRQTKAESGVVDFPRFPGGVRRTGELQGALGVPAAAEADQALAGLDSSSSGERGPGFSF